MCNSKEADQTHDSTAPTSSSTEVHQILLHVIVPDSWQATYVYTGPAEQLGAWPGTAITNGEIRVNANFDTVIVSNGGDLRTMEIHGIQRSQPEAWIVVNEDTSYNVSYSAPEIPEPTPTEPAPTEPASTEPQPTDQDENRPTTGDSGTFFAVIRCRKMEM